MSLAQVFLLWWSFQVKCMTNSSCKPLVFLLTHYYMLWNCLNCWRKLDSELICLNIIVLLMKIMIYWNGRSLKSWTYFKARPEESEEVLTDLKQLSKRQNLPLLEEKWLFLIRVCFRIPFQLTEKLNLNSQEALQNNALSNSAATNEQPAQTTYQQD